MLKPSMCEEKHEELREGKHEQWLSIIYNASNDRDGQDQTTNSGQTEVS